MISLKPLFICFLIFFSHLLYSQPVPTQAALSTRSSKAEKLYREAELLLQKRQWEAAAESFNKAIEKDPDFVEAHYQLGELYRKIGIITKYAEKYLPSIKYHFEKVVALQQASRYPVVYRVLGEIYMHEGNYEQAKKNFSVYTTFPGEPKNYIERCEHYIQQCGFAIENVGKAVQIHPRKLPDMVNRHNKQYFPVTTADQQLLVFTVRDRIGASEYEDIFVSRKINGEWGFPESISDNINSPYLNEGTSSISADGKVLVFTACGGKSKNDFDCDLYISYKQGNEWSRPVNMGPHINSPFWDSQPSLSPDGRTLYFSSKRKGGMGEEDIWVAEADANGVWATPLNMGDIINTPGREVAPFIHPSMTTLYFASDYHPGFGSFDLFVSYKDSVNWSNPKNLGYPINTNLEESSIFITSDCKKAYYSAESKAPNESERYFLYEFDMPKEAGCRQVSTYAKGTVYDASTNTPIAAEVELIDLKTNKIQSLLRSDKVNGQYLVVLNEGSHYGLFVSKQGYLFKSHSFDFETIKTFDPLNLDVYLEPIKQGSSITLNNIFFETGKYKLEKKSAAELDKLVFFLNQNFNLKVEISGHTDNVGQKQNNITLSTKRAESVFDYLVENGIDPNRIRYKGYGDSQPVAPNESEETRQLNRRIECKIL